MKIDKVRCRETNGDNMLYINSISYFNRAAHNNSVLSPYTNRLLDCGVFLIGLPMVYMGDVSGTGKYNAYGSAGMFEEGDKIMFGMFRNTSTSSNLIHWDGYADTTSRYGFICEFSSTKTGAVVSWTKPGYALSSIVKSDSWIKVEEMINGLKNPTNINTRLNAYKQQKKSLEEQIT